MHTGLCYTQRMVATKHLNLLGLLACALLLACTPGSRQLSNTAPGAGGRGLIDNDSYYSQPGSYIPGMAPAPIMYGGCDEINDAPSCGGG